MINELLSFYKFVDLEKDFVNSFSNALRQFCVERKILGTVILAEEGINASLAGNAAQRDIEALLNFLAGFEVFQDIHYKIASCPVLPFKKLKISLKPEIVTFKVREVFPAQKTGINIAPEKWNEVITDPDMLVIDTRNNFECEQGSFQGAINPKTQKFSDFVHFVKDNLNPKQHRKIAMFCTGGIRCEKASSYLLQEGFEAVYQLQGGILEYLNNIEKKHSLWEGKCFVFDERITVD